MDYANLMTDTRWLFETYRFTSTGKFARTSCKADKTVVHSM